jgi:hypothetical protein
MVPIRSVCAKGLIWNRVRRLPETQGGTHMYYFVLTFNSSPPIFPHNKKAPLLNRIQFGFRLIKSMVEVNTRVDI